MTELGDLLRCPELQLWGAEPGPVPGEATILVKGFLELGTLWSISFLVLLW